MKIYQRVLVLTVVCVFVLQSLSIPLAGDEEAGKKASLWRTNSAFGKMYSDPIARSINDIVTIQVSETSTASNKAELTTSKKTQVQMEAGSYEKEISH